MRRVTVDEAVKVIRSGDTILVGGSGGGHAVPEALMAAVERRFLAEGEPRGLTLLHPVGLGNDKGLGAGHFAHEGLLKRDVGGTMVNSPALSALARWNCFPALSATWAPVSRPVSQALPLRNACSTRCASRTSRE